MLSNMASSRRNKPLLARSVWQLMFDLLMRTAPQRTKILGQCGLTPNDARGLSSLDLHEGRSMRSLAKEWTCDASNATWIVDRLEKMGLAERRTVPDDRRVKLVALTRKGLKVRRELLEKFHNPPAQLLELGDHQLKTLEQILRKAVANGESTTSQQHIR
jgi:DNA-binding MarR family transcriptional regulator